MNATSTAGITQAWELPEPAAVLEVLTPDGALVYVRRHGNPDGRRIVFSHGCGLAADSYFPFWSLLLEKFDLFIFDIRSHGWNPTAELRNQNVPHFITDFELILRAIGEKFEEKPVIGLFHSVSALVAMLHEEQWKGFSGLVLYDPPIQPPGGKPEDLVEIGESMSADARRRRDRFRSRNQFARLLRRSPAHRHLLPGMPELIAETTLRPVDVTDEFQLCCPKEHEAQLYEYLFGWAMRMDLQRVSCPVKVIGADPTEPYSFMPTSDFSNLIDVNYDFLPNTSHFLQLEEPQLCLDMALEFLESQRLI